MRSTRGQPPRQIITREEARSRGEPFYFDRTLCPKGRRYPRHTGNGECICCLQGDPPPVYFSRAEARAAGRHAYRIPEPCEAGHEAFRSTASGACVLCEAEERKSMGAAAWEARQKQQTNWSVYGDELN